MTSYINPTGRVKGRAAPIGTATVAMSASAKIASASATGL